MVDIENGCLGEGALQTDYLIEGLEDSLPELKEQNTKRFYYNQGANEWSKKSCTIFASIGAISDLYDYEYPLSEIKEDDEQSYKQGRTKGAGRYVGFAVDLAVKQWNIKHPDKKVNYYRIDISDKETVYKILKKNYNIITGFYGNSNFTLDWSADGILNGTHFSPSTYGHCVNLIMKDGDIYVKDNYKGRKYNEYKLENYPGDINCWHNNGYIITKISEDNELELKKQNKMKSLLTTAIETNSALWETSSDEAYKITLHKMNEENRLKLKVVNEILSKLM